MRGIPNGTIAVMNAMLSVNFNTSLKDVDLVSALVLCGLMDIINIMDDLYEIGHWAACVPDTFGRYSDSDARLQLHGTL
jgi:hypothetical protein